MKISKLITNIGLLVAFAFSGVALACKDSVVLVHGNAGSSDDWSNTYNELLSRGYSSSEIYTPNWGSSNPALNNHSGSEETSVRNAIIDAAAASCTGKVDVIGHSMGVTLAAQQIIKANKASSIDAFVGVAGAYRGLLSCGVYPFNVWTPTCGSQGLSVSSPFLDWLNGVSFADRTYSIKSWVDQVVCSTGSCLIYGVHSSSISGEDATYTYAYGHFGLQKNTASKQVDLIQ